jgi:predicted ArsR family transcriptional regulator
VTQAAIPETVRRFLTDQIGSGERLDVLLFLYRYATRWWAAQTLAAELGMPADAAQSHLEHLSARNLLDVRVAESVIYRYHPVREDLSRLVEDVAQTHYRQRDALLAVLARRAPDSARLFADAFQLRKDKRDDG